MQALQNLGLSVFIILADLIVWKLGYLYLEIIFLDVLSLAFIVGVCNNYIYVYVALTTRSKVLT